MCGCLLLLSTRFCRLGQHWAIITHTQASARMDTHTDANCKRQFAELFLCAWPLSAQLQIRLRPCLRCNVSHLIWRREFSIVRPTCEGALLPPAIDGGPSISVTVHATAGLEMSCVWILNEIRHLDAHANGDYSDVLLAFGSVASLMVIGHCFVSQTWGDQAL